MSEALQGFAAQDPFGQRGQIRFLDATTSPIYLLEKSRISDPRSQLCDLGYVSRKRLLPLRCLVTDIKHYRSAVLASCYTSSWDLLVDWGLLRPHAGYLRESLGYPSLRPVSLYTDFTLRDIFQLVLPFSTTTSR